MQTETLHKDDTYLITSLVALGRAAMASARHGAEGIERAGQQATHSKGYTLYKEAARRLKANDEIIFHALAENSREMIRTRFTYDYCMAAANTLWHFLVMDDEGRAEAEDAILAAYAKYSERKTDAE